VYNAVHNITAYFVNDQDWPEAPHIAHAYLLLLKKICQMSVVDYNYGARGDGLRINDIDRTDIYDGV
jgi:hypothetical protein